MNHSGSAAPKQYDHYEVREAMHTMMRASQIVKDKKLMGHVKKHAAEHAREMSDVAHRAGQLAKKGLISDKQMAKLNGNKGQGGSVKDLDKTTPIA